MRFSEQGGGEVAEERDFVDYEKHFRFYSECSRKPLENLEQGSGIWLKFQKNCSGSWVENGPLERGGKSEGRETK